MNIEMLQAIAVAVITGSFALAGTYYSNRKSSALLEYRLTQLEQKVTLHNNLVSRMYDVEARVTVLEEVCKDEHS